MATKAAVEFFQKQGNNVKTSKALAAAEERARDKGWEFEWSHDEDPDLSWASDEERDNIKEVLVVVLKDENGHVLESLGGIVDPTTAYGREIEAELAFEALSRGKKAGERGAQEVSEDDVRELVLFIDNDGDLYRQMTTPIMKNLAKKMLKGTYNHELAVKGWGHLANAGAKKYTQEFGTPGPNGSYGNFDVATRKAAAAELAEAFESAVKAGDFDVEKLAKGG